MRNVKGIKIQLLGISLLILGVSGGGDPLFGSLLLLGLFLVFIGLLWPDE